MKTEITDLKCKTGKRCYANEREAEDALYLIRFPEKVNRHHQRCYKCHLCGWYHLTSKKYDEKRRSKNVFNS